MIYLFILFEFKLRHTSRMVNMMWKMYVCVVVGQCTLREVVMLLSKPDIIALQIPYN